MTTGMPMVAAASGASPPPNMSMSQMVMGNETNAKGKEIVKNEVHRIYAGVLHTRGINPVEKAPNYADCNLVIALQKDLVKGKMAFYCNARKDYVFAWKQNHPIASVFYCDIYHPLQGMNRVILLFMSLFIQYGFYFGGI